MSHWSPQEIIISPNGKQMNFQITKIFKKFKYIYIYRLSLVWKSSCKFYDLTME